MIERTTHDHFGPAPPSRAAAPGVLIAVFPREVVVPIPDPFAPVGRSWFMAHGIADPKMSSEHLQLAFTDGRLYLADAGSRNGTWVDGHRLAPDTSVPLCDGAVIRAGSTMLVHRSRLDGPRHAAAPIGELVGPFGLREVAADLVACKRLADSAKTAAGGARANVLIEGETGTGKELLARAVAEALGRSRPFAAINVAAVPAGLFEAQLFGHVAGAFSDARHPSKGILAAHDGGAIFLDEIGELPADLQPKLLRLLDSGELLPVGAERPVQIDVLLIAAANRELDVLVEQGSFRRDLCARLSLSRLRIPPLRRRREDVFAIARALGPRCGLALDLDDRGKASSAIEIEAVERLLLEDWPENVRGLMAVLARVAAVDSAPRLRLWAVEKAIGRRAAEGETAGVAPSEPSVRAAIVATGGNESEAARKLGISRGKLRRLLSKG